MLISRLPDDLEAIIRGIDMQENFTPHKNGRAWLIHRGKWSWIKDPLYQEGPSAELAPFVLVDFLVDVCKRAIDASTYR